MAEDRDYTKPPIFRPDIDFQEWRKRVAEWVATLKRAHDKGQNRELINKFQLLGHIFLQEAIPSDQRAVIDDEVKEGRIDLDHEDPIEPVLAMVNRIAIDAPIVQFTRLITTYQAVITCVRHKNEKLVVFASRFRDLAGKHLRQTASSPSSQTGQVLAITLLNNAKLDDVTLTNAKMQLITLAKSREEKEQKNSKASASPASLEEIKGVHKNIVDLVELIPDYNDNGKRHIPKEFTNKMIEKTEELGEAIRKTVNLNESNISELKSIEGMFVDQGPLVTLNLDDSVTVLRNVSQGADNKLTVTLEELSSLVQSGVKTFLAQQKNTNFGGGNFSNNSNNRGSSKQGGKKRQAPADNDNSKNQAKRTCLNELIPDHDNRCLDCGEKGHKRGDDACQHASWASLQIRKARNNSNKNGGFLARAPLRGTAIKPNSPTQSRI